MYKINHRKELIFRLTPPAARLPRHLGYHSSFAPAPNLRNTHTVMQWYHYCLRPKCDFVQNSLSLGAAPRNVNKMISVFKTYLLLGCQ
jgi:hypothetical protein